MDNPALISMMIDFIMVSSGIYHDQINMLGFDDAFNFGFRRSACQMKRDGLTLLHRHCEPSPGRLFERGVSDEGPTMSSVKNRTKILARIRSANEKA